MSQMAGAPKGNTNAQKGKQWSDAVRKALLSGKKLDKLAEVLINKALEGDMQAIKEIGDRLDGKAVQAIGNDDAGELVVRFVD